MTQIVYIAKRACYLCNTDNKPFYLALWIYTRIKDRQAL